MSAPPEISVIVRARDEAANLDRCLQIIRGQRTVGRVVELIVVDSGSRDATVQVALDHGARVVTMPHSAFTFGGALNLGAANARGELLVALSAHAFAPDPDWLARLLDPFEDARVACASGDQHDPDGAPLGARVLQDLELARRRPEWGYSNGAGAFRAALWRARPFRSDLPGCEDKEWAWHWLTRGYLCAIDPGLDVGHDHTHDALPSIFRRARREAAGYGGFLALPPYGPRELVRDWWLDLRWYSSATRARLSPRRTARLLGAYAGRRRPQRRGSPLRRRGGRSRGLPSGPGS